MRDQRRSRAAGLLAVALTALLAACGGSPSVSGGSGSSAPVPPLTVAVPSPLVDFMQIYIAKAAGYFDKEGVSVSIIDNTGANTLNMLIAGQSDLDMYTAPVALKGAEQGKPTTIIYAVERDPGAALIGSGNVTSIAQLQAMSSCRLAAGAQGSQGYAYGVIYLKKLSLKCDQVVAATAGLILAGLKSGSYQAAVTTYNNALLAVQNGDHMLINPLDPNDAKKYSVQPYPTATFFGLPDNLKAKKESVVRFLRAINDANVLIHKGGNLQELTNLMLSIDAFKPTPADVMQQQIQSIIPFIGAGMGSKPGYIPQDLWNNALQQYTVWGLDGFDPGAAVNSYKQRVDMSYYDAAIK